LTTVRTGGTFPETAVFSAIFQIGGGGCGADLADRVDCRWEPAPQESIMFGIGTTELLVILGIVIVIFGARRLPELGTGIGQAIKNFKKGLSSKDEIDVTPKKEEVSEGENPSGH